MSLDPIIPRRPLLWPDVVELVANAAPDASRLYLVGGAVRDALRGYPIHDVDLATPDNGLHIARKIANALGGAYYPVDAERGTGRAILPTPDGDFVIDVATFRADDLLGDLRGRDFTVNAIAVPLNQLDILIDPLGGQADLFDHKILRQCSPESIANDPVRALRAVRMALQLNLRMAPETREAARAAADWLQASPTELVQPERIRDEVFKLLSIGHPSSALRILNSLGILAKLTPFTLPSREEMDRTFLRVQTTASLLAIISPQRNDNTAAELMLGVAVMVLDRFRQQLIEHLWTDIAGGRTRAQLLVIAALTPQHPAPAVQWANYWRLSNSERQILSGVFVSESFSLPLPNWEKDRDRAIYHYFQATGESGVDGVILSLANYLSDRGTEIDPETWGSLLDQAASPMLEGYFHRYHEVVAPPPLLTGTDLMEHLNLKPGPQIGKLIASLTEEQAAGTIHNKKEALQLAKRLLDNPV